MFYDPNEESRDYDDDERYYEETVYNEQYYLEREQELIRESNLEIETEEHDENNIRDMQAETLLQPLPPSLERTTPSKPRPR